MCMNYGPSASVAPSWYSDNTILLSVFAFVSFQMSLINLYVHVLGPGAAQANQWPHYSHSECLFNAFAGHRGLGGAFREQQNNNISELCHAKGTIGLWTKKVDSGIMRKADLLLINNFILFSWHSFYCAARKRITVCAKSINNK